MSGGGRLRGIVMGYRALWLRDPFIAAAIAFVLGLLPFLYAAYNPIGYVTITMVPDGGEAVVKRVGYLYAINWSLVLAVILPLTLFFAMRSVRSLRSAVEDMVKSGMCGRTDWSAPCRDVGGAVFEVWRIALIFGAVIFLIFAYTMVRDWQCVVHGPLVAGTVFAGNPEAIPTAACPLPDAHENDWSISAVFPTEPQAGLEAYSSFRPLPGWSETYVFSAYVYLLATLFVGSLLAYYGFIIAFAIVLMRNRTGRLGFVIVPNLHSKDERKRMGFEHLEGIFRPCVYATIGGFLVAFTTRIQNLYLRDPGSNDIFEFAFKDFLALLGSLFAGEFADLTLKDISGWLQSMFSVEELADPQAFLGLMVVLMVLSIVAITLAYILGEAARDARSTVLREMKSEDGARRVSAYYKLDADTIEDRARALQTWPLSWPEMRQARNLFAVGIVCFLFFRLAFVWAAYALYRLLKDGFREKHAA